MSGGAVVERVARALCEASHGVPDALVLITAVTKGMLPPDGFDENGKSGHFYWRTWAGRAQAALDACHVDELVKALHANDSLIRDIRHRDACWHDDKMVKQLLDRNGALLAKLGSGS